MSDPTRKYPVYRFYYLNDGEKRVVQLLKDVGYWDFYSEGTPLEIETLENYSARKKSDRLNNKIIIDYLENLDYPITETDFWRSSGMAIENRMFTNM